MGTANELMLQTQGTNDLGSSGQEGNNFLIRHQLNNLHKCTKLKKAGCRAAGLFMDKILLLVTRILFSLFKVIIGNTAFLPGSLHRQFSKTIAEAGSE